MADLEEKEVDFLDHASDSEDDSADEPRGSRADCSDESDLASTEPAADGHCNSKSSRTYHSWSKEESALLESLVREHGCYRKWTLIAKHLPGRTGKQCRDRWNNHLRPGLKQGSWSAEEDYVLAYWHSKRGGSWAAIAFWLPGRTAVAIKNHWNAVNKLSEKGGKDTVLTTYANLLRTGLSREESYKQAVKKVGLPSEWSAVLDQTLEASKYDNHSALNPPKWEEILRAHSLPDAKRSHTHAPPITGYATHVSTQRFQQAPSHATRHSILHPCNAPYKSHQTTHSHPSSLPSLPTSGHQLTHTPLTKPISHHPMLNKSLKIEPPSSPSSGSSETDHSTLVVKSHSDRIPERIPDHIIEKVAERVTDRSAFHTVSHPHSPACSPSSAPSSDPTFPSSHSIPHSHSHPADYPPVLDPATAFEIRASALFQLQQRGLVNAPASPFSSSTLDSGDYFLPSDYPGAQSTSSWWPHHASVSTTSRWSSPGSESHSHYSPSPYFSPAPTATSTDQFTAHTNRLSPCPAGPNYMFPDDFSVAVTDHHHQLHHHSHPPSQHHHNPTPQQPLIDDFSLLPSSYPLPTDQVRTKLREQIVNERKRRFTQAFPDGDVPSQSPLPWSGPQQYPTPAPFHMDHGVMGGAADFFDGPIIKYEPLV